MKTAIIFPGQGSQRTGMLSELATEHPVIQATFAEAADIVGVDYWAMAQAGPDEKLADTRFTQPLMTIGNIAIWRLLQELGLDKPVAVAGHSLGEYSAMIASNALSFEDGISLVAVRAELMASAVPEGEGGMAALIGMDDDAVIKLCKQFSDERVVEAANFNAPGQVAISGHVDALERLAAEARDHGARKAMVLPVSVPNHSSLMRDAGEALAQKIDSIEWRMPDIPLLQNATAQVAEDQNSFLSILREHVYNPVYWTTTVQNLRDHYSVERLIECGPGKVLTGLGKRIDKTVPTLATEAPALIDAIFADQAAEA